MGWRRPGNAGTAAAVAQLVPFQLDPARGSAQRACDWLWGGLVPFQLVSPKNACPRPWTERNLYPDRSPFGDRFGFVRPLLNFCVVRAKHLAQIVGTALVVGQRPAEQRHSKEDEQRPYANEAQNPAVAEQGIAGRGIPAEQREHERHRQ